MKRIVWLDDVRNPYSNPWIKDVIHASYSDNFELLWTKSYYDFKEAIMSGQTIDVIFFDHDLGDGKSGMDCMKLFINYIIENNINPNNFEVYFQSMNPVGKENMKSLFERYTKFYNEEMRCIGN